MPFYRSRKLHNHTVSFSLRGWRSHKPEPLRTSASNNLISFPLIFFWYHYMHLQQFRKVFQWWQPLSGIAPESVPLWCNLHERFCHTMEWNRWQKQSTGYSQYVSKKEKKHQFIVLSAKGQHSATQKTHTVEGWEKKINKRKTVKRLRWFSEQEASNVLCVKAGSSLSSWEVGISLSSSRSKPMTDQLSRPTKNLI